MTRPISFYLKKHPADTFFSGLTCYKMGKRLHFRSTRFLLNLYLFGPEFSSKGLRNTQYRREENSSICLFLNTVTPFALGILENLAMSLSTSSFLLGFCYFSWTTLPSGFPADIGGGGHCPPFHLVLTLPGSKTVPPLL